MTSRIIIIALLLGWFLGFSISTRLYAEASSLADTLGQSDVSALANLDLSAMTVLPDMDSGQLQSICHELQKHFQGGYELGLVPSRELASAALPLLEQHAETQPCADWLRPRLDSFTVAPSPHE